MCQARYEIVEDDGAFYGHIPAIPGVWANAKTLEACRLNGSLSGETE
jgi:predicted RNase H-like HicB family nuclease